MNEYESNMKEHRITIVIGVVLIALLAIFVAKKRSRLEPEPYGVRPVSEGESDFTEDILSDTYLAEEEYAAGAREDEISVSIGRGDGVVEPVVVSVAPDDVAPDDEEVIEPVSREQESEEHTTYVVKKGDTLSAIAQRFYGDASRWRLIAKANDLSDPNTVRVGMELIIPQQQKVKPSRPAAEPRIDVAASGEDETKKARDYIVKKDDSLWKIAAAEYGDGNKWPTVFEANRNSIRNKNLLRPGQVIRLPEP